MMRTSRRVTAVAAVAVLVVGSLAIHHATTRRTTAIERRDQAAVTSARLAQVEADAVLAVGHAETATAEQRRQRIRLEATRSDLEDAIERMLAAIDSETAATGDVVAQNKTAQQQLDDLSARLGVQALAIAPLRDCVGGIAEASEALRRSRDDLAAAALDRVTDACAAARSGTSARPAFPFDFPDPHVVWSGSQWVAFATNSTAGAVQMITSADLHTWSVRGNALAGLPGWGRPGATWAPSAIEVAGGWRLYYTLREDSSGLQCISVASSTSATGPFTDSSTEPLVCEREEGGSIDPQPVRDSTGGLALWWKTELDTLGAAAELRAAPLDDDGTALAGPATLLLRAGASWEGRTIEAPAVLYRDGIHLLYSANSWSSSRYGVGDARCVSVLGPCTRTGDRPVLSTSGGRLGPGGLSTFELGDGTGVAFHAWADDEVGYPHNRYLHIGSITVSDGRARVSTG